VRHAQGTHNISQLPIQKRDLDARLTPEGEAQCAALQRATAALRPHLVATSPLTRTLQTAIGCFEPQRKAAGAPLIAVEALRETVNFKCDTRRPISRIRPEFPAADFSQCVDDEDALWARYEAVYGSAESYSGHREMDRATELAARARTAMEWLGARAERDIVVVSHSAFYGHLFAYGQETSRRLGKLPRVFEYAEPAVRDWMTAPFANCECRTVIATFSLSSGGS
jgi:broad specificity phosphatase PhoE